MNIKASINRWVRIIKRLKKHENRFKFIERNLEHLLQERHLENNKMELSYKNRFRSKEYKVHSQNGEDGLILYIFSQIGVTNRKFIEFGIGDGTECNSANLLLNFGWSGLMIEGSSDYVNHALNYYNSNPKMQGDLKILNQFITKENINDLFEEGGVEGEIDLLSIDIDGNDYWVWEAIDRVSPRVIIAEYNSTFGIKASITVAYDPAFMRREKHKSGYYQGASLKALEKLGKEKGYVLVGCDCEGVNAFFVRKDIPLGDLQIISAEEAYYEQPVRTAVCSTEEQFNMIKHLPIVEV